jgi:ankyrin repeat protein
MVKRASSKADESLISACVAGDMERARAALDEGARIDGGGALIPLVEATRYGHLELARFLLARGAAPSAREEPLGETALFEAAKKGHEAIIDLLLGAGAAVDERDRHDITPLMRAASDGAATGVQHLLARGADPNAKAQSGGTAFHFTATASPVDAFETIFAALRGAGGSLSAKDLGGRTVLHCACMHARLPGVAIERMLDAGLEVDARDDAGCTPLWYSARSARLDYVRLLLSRGADPNARAGCNDESVYDVARQRGSFELLGALRDAGAVTRRESKPSTPSPPADPFRVGAAVTHPKFGAGEVVATEGRDADRKATVRFANGTRVMLLKYLTAAEPL